MSEQAAAETNASMDVQAELIQKSAMRTDRSGREYRFIISAIQSPYKIDKQDDWTDDSELEDALHEFAISLQKQSDPQESGVSYRHARMVTSEQAAIVELWQLRKAEVWGDKTLPAGTAMVGMRIYDSGLCDEIDSGKITGISIEGWGHPVPMPLPERA